MEKLNRAGRRSWELLGPGCRGSSHLYHFLCPTLPLFLCHSLCCFCPLLSWRDKQVSQSSHSIMTEQMPQTLALSFKNSFSGILGSIHLHKPSGICEDLPLEWALVWPWSPTALPWSTACRFFWHWHTRYPLSFAVHQNQALLPFSMKVVRPTVNAIFSLCSDISDNFRYTLVFDLFIFFMERSGNYTLQRMEIKLCHYASVYLFHTKCALITRRSQNSFATGNIGTWVSLLNINYLQSNSVYPLPRIPPR